MHRNIYFVVICLLVFMQATHPAQNLPATSNKNPFQYISTPHSTRMGKGKVLRPTLIEELFNYARTGNIQKLREMYDEYGTLDEPLEGFTAIYHATMAGKLESVIFLSSSGAHMTRLFPAMGQENQHSNDLVQESPLVESLLDIALMKGHRDLALFLVQFIPLWFPNGRGELPLCNAFRYKRPDLAYALIMKNSCYTNYLAAQEITNESETALSCARRLGYHDIADFIEIALIQPSTPEKADALQKKSILTSRWVVIPSLCALAIGALYIIKTPASKRLLELAQFHLFYQTQHLNIDQIEAN